MDKRPCKSLLTTLFVSKGFRAEKQIAVLLLLLYMMGCSGNASSPKNERSLASVPSTELQNIVLATTTSTLDSGLLEPLLAKFREKSGIEVKAIAVGSGQAMEIGRRGDADVLVTHSPEAEEKFMAEGHGSFRRRFMHNDFVLVGPADDPGGLKEIQSASEALARLSEKKIPFISRGDDSGTHHKEKALWKLANLTPEGEWYVSAGAGMGAVLRMADQKRAYTLTDRGTFLSQAGKLDLKIVVELDPPLENPYSVMVVSSAKHPGVKEALARKFAEFLLAPETQYLIGDFGREKFGQPLFFPDAEKQE